MHNDTDEHWRDAVDRIRQQNMARAGKLERELATVRQEYSALHQNYLDLGVRASRLAAERDTALKNLGKTEAYIATLESGRATEPAGSQPLSGATQRPDADTAPAGSAVALPAHRLPGADDEPHGLRKAVETIKDYVTPADTLLKNELLMLRRDLSELGNAYLALGEQVNTLSIERDDAIENLRKAQEIIDARFQTGAGEEPQAVARPVEPQPSMGAADALAETLARALAEKNDLEIALAERDDRIATLLAQEQQVQEQAGVLGQRLAAVEEQRQADEEQARSVQTRLREEAGGLAQRLARADLEAMQALKDELQALKSASATTDAADQQHIAELQERLAEVEPQLEAAQQKITDLTASLAESWLNLEFAEQRLEQGERVVDVREQWEVLGKEWERPLQGIEKPADELLRRVNAPVTIDNAEQPVRRPLWLKTAAGFVVLVLVLVGLAKLPGPGNRGAGESHEIAALEVPHDRIIRSAGKNADGGAPPPEQVSLAVGATAAGPVTPPVAEVARRELDTRAAWQRQCRQKGLEEPACGMLGLNMFQGSVVNLPGGVQYSVLRNGTGIAPAADDVVMVQYRGILLDGSEFDSSRQRGGPVSFRVDEAIPGLQYVLRHMEEGARWEVYVPAELAYRKPAAFGGQPVAFDIALISVAGSGRDSVQTEAFPVVVASPQEHPDAGVIQEPPGWQKAETATRAFLQDNAGREGVVSLPSGLQYRVLDGGYGRGRSPQETDTVTLRYRGLLPDGSEFESSDQEGEAVTFSMQQVIPGWHEALLQMEEGAKWQLVLPPELAHSSEVTKLGTRGLPPLIYELELVSIN